MMLRSSTGLLVALAAPFLCAATLRVPEDHADIQAAIDAARDGDEVLVAPGEYVLTRPIMVKGKAVQLHSLAGPQETTLRMSPLPDDPLLAGVFIFDSTPPGTVLEGFTITGGQGSSLPVLAPSVPQGGGVLLGRGHLTIVRCVISRNRAWTGGGIAVVREGNLALRDCVVTQNLGGAGGRLLAGGMEVSNSVLTVERTAISGNYPAGLDARTRSTVFLYDCRLIGNLSFQGGGLRVTDTALTAVNCILAGNYAANASRDGTGGGALALTRSSTVHLTNCTIVHNAAELNGGGIEVAYGGDSTLLLTNCILWDNQGGDIWAPSGTTNIGVHSSNLLDSRRFPGTDNLEVDPGFFFRGIFDFSSFVEVEIGGQTARLPDFIVDPGDYRLRAGSPLIDGGTRLRAPSRDIDGKPRPCGRAPDIGAHEHGDCRHFRRGDADADGALTLSDALFTLRYLFALGEAPQPSCADAADTDDSGRLDIADPIYLLNRLFLGGPRPPQPRDCGQDATEDALACESYPPCDP